MQTRLVWKEKLQFEAELGSHRVEMDTQPPLGTNRAPSPKQLVLAGLAGCTAMDVIALLRKRKQEVRSFELEADAPTLDADPSVFTEVRLTYRLEGDIDGSAALEAVRLSQTRYCAVSAMISKCCPIAYVVEVNDSKVGEGQAEFRLPS